ncbi:Putative LOC101740088, partial [Caligus rogercresseyi]
IFALFGASVGSNLYTPTPRYGPTPVPHYSPSPSPAYGPHGYSTPYGYTPAPLYGHHGSAAPLRETYGPPSCSKNSTNTWCLMDYDYPTYEIQHAVEYHYAAVAALYKDVIANTENSIDRLKDLRDETYLCPSSTDYVMPLRAINSQGKWRIIVNNVKAHYETLSQTVRVEQCSSQDLPVPFFMCLYLRDLRRTPKYPLLHPTHKITPLIDYEHIIYILDRNLAVFLNVKSKQFRSSIHNGMKKVFRLVNITILVLVSSYYAF